MLSSLWPCCSRRLCSGLCRRPQLTLNANPLLDIRHTQSIDGLFFDGRYLDRAALDRLLAYAERQAGHWRSNLHLLWAALRSPLLRVQFAD